jgi:hypothetical protein
MLLGSPKFNNKSCALTERLEMALNEFEKWKRFSDDASEKVVDSQKILDGYIIIESLPSRLEAVEKAIRTYQQIACDGKTNCVYLQRSPADQGPDNPILTRLEAQVEDLKRVINSQHMIYQGDVGLDRTWGPMDARNMLESFVGQLREERDSIGKRYKEETTRLREETTRLTSTIEVMEKRYRESIDSLISYQSDYTAESKRLNAGENEGLNKQICELQEQVRAFGLKLEDTKTMRSREDMERWDLIIRGLPSDLETIKSKLHEMKSHDSIDFSTLARDIKSSVREKDSQLDDWRRAMHKYHEEVDSLQRRIKAYETVVQERDAYMAKLSPQSRNTFIKPKPTNESASRLNEDHDPRNELERLREELDQVEKNIMYFTSTFPPSAEPFSAAMEERLLGKVPVTERLRLLIERVRYRITDLESSLQLAKLNYKNATRPEDIMSSSVLNTSEFHRQTRTPLPEPNNEFFTPTGNGATPPRDSTEYSRERGLQAQSPVPSLRAVMKSVSTQTGTHVVFKDLTVARDSAVNVRNTDRPTESRTRGNEHALGSDDMSTDLERLRASLILHLCTMLFAKTRPLDLERLRDRKGIFAKRYINKDLDLLKKVIHGYSKQPMKHHGANEELRKITYKGMKAFPEALLNTYKTMFKTLLTLAQPFDVDDLISNNNHTKREPMRPGNSIEKQPAKENAKRKRRSKPNR